MTSMKISDLDKTTVDVEYRVGASGDIELVTHYTIGYDRCDDGLNWHVFGLRGQYLDSYRTEDEAEGVAEERNLGVIGEIEASPRPMDADLVSAVRRHATANYNLDGWDIIVESYSNEDLWQIIADSRNPAEAIELARLATTNLDRLTPIDWPLPSGRCY